MAAFEASFVVRRPLEDVFALLTNLEEDVKWRREWVDGKKKSEGPIGVGTRFSLVAGFLGRRIETVYETTEYEPGRLAAWKAVSGPLPLTFRRSFEQVPEGTRVSFAYDGEFRGVLKLLRGLLVRAGRRQLDGDLPRLRDLMEGTAAPVAPAEEGPRGAHPGTPVPGS